MKTSVSLLVGLVGLGSLADAAAMLPRSWKFEGDTCNDEKKDILKEEIGQARKMASAAKEIKGDNLYYKTFMSDLHQELDVVSSVQKSFGKMAGMLDKDNDGYEIKLTCDDGTNGCSKKGWWAHMNDGSKTMNFCDKFFKNKEIISTKDRLDDCKNIDLRAAQRTRGSVIVHETAHTEYGMDNTGLSRDYAYGFNGCYQLARGGFDRSCAPYKGKEVLCPDKDGNESWCAAELEVKNADTWSFMATGVYFSKECGKEIPLPDLPKVPGKSKRAGSSRAEGSPRRVFRRADECTGFDDYIVWDGEDEDE